MLAHLRNRSAVLGIALCFALSAVWISGVHAHRHGDLGHPQSMHAQVDEDGHHDQAGGHQAALTDADAHAFEQDGWHALHGLAPDLHEDVEQPGVSAGTVKPPGGDLLAVALLMVGLVLLLRRRSAGRLVPQAPPSRLLKSVHLRPPLRGPPSFSVV